MIGWRVHRRGFGRLRSNWRRTRILPGLAGYARRWRVDPQGHFQTFSLPDRVRKARARLVHPGRRPRQTPAALLAHARETLNEPSPGSIYDTRLRLSSGGIHGRTWLQLALVWSSILGTENRPPLPSPLPTYPARSREPTITKRHERARTLTRASLSSTAQSSRRLLAARGV